MTTTQEHKPTLVLAYDRTVVREYLKRYGGFIFSSTETVHSEQLSNTLEVQMTSDRKPDRIFFNGVEMKLVPLDEQAQ